jgi:hypothetical protein
VEMAEAWPHLPSMVVNLQRHQLPVQELAAQLALPAAMVEMQALQVVPDIRLLAVMEVTAVMVGK